MDTTSKVQDVKCVCTSSVLLREEEFWAAEEWFYTDKFTNTSEGVIHLL